MWILTKQYATTLYTREGNLIQPISAAHWDPTTLAFSLSCSVGNLLHSSHLKHNSSHTLSPNNSLKKKNKYQFEEKKII